VIDPTATDPSTSRGIVTDEYPHDDEPLRRPRGRRAAPKPARGAVLLAPLTVIAAWFVARAASIAAWSGALPGRVPQLGRAVTWARSRLAPVGRALAPAVLWARGHRPAVVIAGAGLVAVAMLGGAVAVIGSTAGQVDEAGPAVESPRPTPGTTTPTRAYPPILPTATPPADETPTTEPDDGAADDPGTEPTVEPEPAPETAEPTPEPTPEPEDDHPGRGQGPKKPKG
jgi:hypothetical protein